MVVEIRSDKVRLGVTADPSVFVHRDEVYDAIRRQAAEGKPLRPIEDELDAEENANE